MATFSSRSSRFEEKEKGDDAGLSVEGLVCLSCVGSRHGQEKKSGSADRWAKNGLAYPDEDFYFLLS